MARISTTNKKANGSASLQTGPLGVSFGSTKNTKFIAFLRKSVNTLGRFYSTVVLVSLAVIFSWLISGLALITLQRRGVEIDLALTFAFATLIPLIVSSTMTWPFMELLLRIDDLETEMRHLAEYDSLTGLLNRRAFAERVNYLINIAKRERQDFSILLVDLDNFKEINDSHGHAIGDEVLRLFGNIVQKNLRKSDLACRFGGEEFAFFLPNKAQEDALHFSNRLHNLVSGSKVNNNGTQLAFTISIGLASYPEIPPEEVEQLLKAADKAMYTAKESGKNQTSIYKKAS